MAFIVFFFSSRRRHRRCGRDWSSDVSCSDLAFVAAMDVTKSPSAATKARLPPAASLGAGRWTTFRRVTLPLLRPALAAGGSLAFVAALDVTKSPSAAPKARPPPAASAGRDRE